MKRLLIILCYASLLSCQDKVICPAYQSTYILDSPTRDAYFSYVWQLDENTRNQFLAQQRGEDPNDTLAVGEVVQPKTDYYAYAGEKVVPWRIQKKTKYGIIKEPISPIIKDYQMRTAPMENVHGPEEVTNDFVASDFTDSLGVDSLAIAMDSLTLDSTAAVASAEPIEAKEETKYLYRYDPSDNFNVEQEYYNKYFGEKFIDRRPKPEPKPVALDSLGNPIVPDSVATKEPFFKGLFKKKNKKKDEPIEESEEETPPPAESEATTEEGEEESGEEGGND